MINVMKGIRLYKNGIDRKRARTMLRKEGYTYFVDFADVNGYGLSFGNKEKNTARETERPTP